MPPSPICFPAFKEWQVIVEALGSGEQSIILRKGGISEGRNGFQMEASRFWLFPTRFHAQRDKTKPAAARWFSTAEPTPSVPLACFADVVQTGFLDRWDDVARLDPFHFWTEPTIRERFEWGNPAGMHAMVVRVHRLDQPVTLPLSEEMSGCKSWINLPLAFDQQTSQPVLNDAAHKARLALIGAQAPSLRAQP